MRPLARPRLLCLTHTSSEELPLRQELLTSHLPRNQPKGHNHILNDEYSVMEKSFRHLQAVLDTHLAGVGRRRNARLPLFRLPDEILARILFFSLQASFPRPRDDVDKLHNLAKVCTKFAALTRNSTPLWGLVDAQSSIENTALVLAKSKSAPLDVIHTTLRRLRARNNPFLETVSPESWRWRSLELIAVTIDAEKKALSLSTPQLRDLTIQHAEYSGATGYEQIPDTTLARLHHLSLSPAEVSIGIRMLLEDSGRWISAIWRKGSRP